MERITSRENPLVKEWCSYIKSAQCRHNDGLFCVEGVKMCAEAATFGIEILRVFVTDSCLNKYNDQCQKVILKSKTSFIISNSVSEKLSDTKTPQGIFALCKIPENSLNSMGRKRIILDSVSDPGNAGTIIRTAEAMGIDEVIFIGTCVDPYSPKVVRSTMGSIFRQNVILCPDRVAAINSVKNQGTTVYSSELDSTAQTIGNSSLKGNVAVVIGNESNGVSQEVSCICDGKIYIPMKGNSESLNAAVAASIIMWEMAKDE